MRFQPQAECYPSWLLWVDFLYDPATRPLPSNESDNILRFFSATLRLIKGHAMGVPANRLHNGRKGDHPLASACCENRITFDNTAPKIVQHFGHIILSGSIPVTTRPTRISVTSAMPPWCLSPNRESIYDVKMPSPAFRWDHRRVPISNPKVFRCARRYAFTTMDPFNCGTVNR